MIVYPGIQSVSMVQFEPLQDVVQSGRSLSTFL
jgi:hypothetical protein